MEIGNKIKGLRLLRRRQEDDSAHICEIQKDRAGAIAAHGEEMETLRTDWDATERERVDQHRRKIAELKKKLRFKSTPADSPPGRFLLCEGRQLPPHQQDALLHAHRGLRLQNVVAHADGKVAGH